MVSTVRIARILPACLTLTAVLVPPPPSFANGGDGGASAPAAGTPSSVAGRGGGASPGSPRHRRIAHRRAAPVLTSFSLRRPRLFLYGRAARVRFRLRGQAPVRARLELLPPEGRRPVEAIDLGVRRPGVTHSVTLTGRESGTLPQGDYVVHISGRDARGRRLRPAARASSTARLSVYHHVFPLAGAFSFGGDDARFGAQRRGHSHQGQDLAAARGTPVLAPRGGRIVAVEHQARAAGHYVVIDGAGENRDYAFMHLRSVVVEEGDRVRTGEHLADVGSTGRSSGPHLHFEVWRGGWHAAGGEPVDPLPLLRAWNGFS